MEPSFALIQLRIARAYYQTYQTILMNIFSTSYSALYHNYKLRGYSHRGTGVCACVTRCAIAGKERTEPREKQWIRDFPRKTQPQGKTLKPARASISVDEPVRGCKIENCPFITFRPPRRGPGIEDVENRPSRRREHAPPLGSSIIAASRAQIYISEKAQRP